MRFKTGDKVTALRHVHGLGAFAGLGEVVAVNERARFPYTVSFESGVLEASEDWLEPVNEQKPEKSVEPAQEPAKPKKTRKKRK